jgi:hypothetical protein
MQVVTSALLTGRLYPKELFLVIISVRGLPSGIKPATNCAKAYPFISWYISLPYQQNNSLNEARLIKNIVICVDVEVIYCVLYTVYCILCTVYCVLYTVYSILCTVYCILYTVYCVLCTVYCVLCAVCCVLYTVYCVLYTVYCILYTVYCILYTVYCILCTVYRVLYTLYCVLCTVYCVLYTVYCILHTVYCIRVQAVCLLLFSFCSLGWNEDKRQLALNTPVYTIFWQFNNTVGSVLAHYFLIFKTQYKKMSSYETHSTYKTFLLCYEKVRDDIVAISACFMIKWKCRLVRWRKQIKHERKCMRVRKECT